MRYLFIINAKARKRNVTYLKKEIQRIFLYHEYEIVLTERPKHATDIARMYAQLGQEMTIFACGGDGTINEVLQGMYAYPHVALGVIPIGTGNDFIKSLAINKQDFFKLERYLTPHYEMCDVLKVQQYVAINTISIGLDVLVAKNVNKFKKGSILKGALPYYFGLLYSMLSTLSNEYTLIIDDQQLTHQAYSFIVACNGGYYGGGYHPCPNANLNDGNIDLCLIYHISRRKIIQLSNKYKKGTHIQPNYQDLVTTRQCKTMQIIAKEKIAINFDGEIVELENPKIEILAKQVKLCIP